MAATLDDDDRRNAEMAKLKAETQLLEWQNKKLQKELMRATLEYAKFRNETLRATAKRFSIPWWSSRVTPLRKTDDSRAQIDLAKARVELAAQNASWPYQVWHELKSPFLTTSA